jgi:hypothetical protein
MNIIHQSNKALNQAGKVLPDLVRLEKLFSMGSLKALPILAHSILFFRLTAFYGHKCNKKYSR